MLYECSYISPLYHWLLDILMQVCNFNPQSNLRFLYFDSFYQDAYQKKICNLFLAAYVCTVWKNRKENMRIGILRKIVIRSVKGYIDILLKMMCTHLEDLFGPYWVRVTHAELEKLH